MPRVSDGEGVPIVSVGRRVVSAHPDGSAQPQTIVVVAAVIAEDSRYLVTRRLRGTHLEGHWEFPGGKVDAGETHAAALRREIQEELGANIEVGALELATAHTYPDRTIALAFYRCRLLSRPRPLLGQEMRWVEAAELPSLVFPPADAELITRLAASAAR